ncbi:DAK2 domain-containing protein [Streptomyces thinghirensis]|nr:DAK2 domain-containing protein [Streptomyces thinghirensis]
MTPLRRTGKATLGRRRAESRSGRGALGGSATPPSWTLGVPRRRQDHDQCPGACRDAFGDFVSAARAAAEEGRGGPCRCRRARAGRAISGERSIGHQDPGATSAALLVAALEEAAGE